MATANERLATLTTAINANNDKLDKAKAEIVAAADKAMQMLKDLRDAYDAGAVSEEVVAAAEASVAAFGEKATSLDDLNVDVENPEVTPVPEPDSSSDPFL